MTTSSTPNYFSIIPSEFKLDGGAMFGIIPKPLWSKKIPSDELNRIKMALRVLLVQTAGRIILIDSGIGDYHEQKFNDRHGVSKEISPLASILLSELNISAEQVTDIIPSHLHFDHVGGFIKLADGKVKPVFPNATLHLHKEHYRYSLSPTIRDTGSFQTEYFQPIIDFYINNSQINWLSAEEGEILQDGNYSLQYKCSHGHTPYHVHPFDERMIFMGDLLPTHSHLPLAWVIGYDMQPGVVPQERLSFYQFIERQNLTMIFDHDLEFWGSKLEFIHHHSQFQILNPHPQKNPYFDPLTF